MKDKLNYIYIISFFSILTVTPGRFVFGIPIIFEFIFLTFVGIIIDLLIKKFNFEKIADIIVISVLLSCTILIRQVTIMINAEVALTLGFSFYLPPLSYFLINLITFHSNENISLRLKTQIYKSLKYCIFGLFFYLFRDIASYGTFTFFGRKHLIYEKILLSPDFIGPFSFFATIPGAFILSAFIIFVKIYINKKFDIVVNSGEAK